MNREPAAYVDPMIDTAKPRLRWVYSVGTVRPGGLVRLSPNTDPAGTWDAGYRYDSPRIACFSHLHSWQLSGVPVMPTTKRFSGGGFDVYASSFSHEREVAQPGYYRVHLEDQRIDAEITSTSRVGFHRYTFPPSGTRALVFDICSELGPSRMADARCVQNGPKSFCGYVENETTSRRNRRIRVFFSVELNCNIASWIDIPTIESHAAGAGVYLELEAGDRPVLMKIGVSFTSEEGASRNLNGELPGWNFDAVRQDSWSEWNDMLGRIRVSGGSEEDTIKFYTDLFRLLSAPQTQSDIDGSYCHLSDGTARILQTRRDESGKPIHPQLCGHDGFWNSQWSTNVALSLAYPDVYSDMCNHLVDFYRDGGLIPRGPAAGSYTYVMIAAPTTPFLVAAYMKGIRDFDIQHAYEGMVKNSLPGGLMSKAGYEHTSNIGGGIEYYIDRGYIPAGRHVDRVGHVDGAAQTLEYAFQDWSLAQLATELGYADSAAIYADRSLNYRNIFDSETGFMRPRADDGTWLADFDPLSLDDFCEANSWQYSFHVMQNMQDLIGLMGGPKEFTRRLDDAFTKSAQMNFYAKKPELHRDRAYINYGNEPGRYVAHLFAHAGTPWLTQKWSREVKRKTFGAITPMGFCEDDDIGKAAATSLLLSLGLFDIRGGASRHPIYELTAPVFETVRIELNRKYYQGRSFTMDVRGNANKHPYIQNVSLNGARLDRLWIYHEEFAHGGSLVIDVGPEPKENLGSSVRSRPPSD